MPHKLLTRVQDPAVDRLQSELGPSFQPIAEALRRVPRDLFTSSEFSMLIYDERYLPVAEGHSMQPIDAIARMVAALELSPGSRVLEVGTGVGYTAALLSKLASQVHTVERLEPLAEIARKNLEGLQIKNVSVHVGDGFKPVKDLGPFDAVLISSNCIHVPSALKDLLAQGGRLVAALGPHKDRLSLIRVTRVGTREFSEQTLGTVRFVMRLGDILVDRGVVGRDDIERAAILAKAGKSRLGESVRQVINVEESDIYPQFKRSRAGSGRICFSNPSRFLTYLELRQYYK